MITAIIILKDCPPPPQKKKDRKTFKIILLWLCLALLLSYNEAFSILPSGKMFPTTGDLHVAPFFDDALYMEHFSKANFW